VWRNQRAAPIALDRIRRIGRGKAPELLGIVDAGSALLEPMAGEGWMAVGDAATAFDPVSGQGLANCLVSGFIGAHAASDHLAGRNSALTVYSSAMKLTHERTARLVAEIYGAIEASVSSRDVAL
jgi:flavin-dependent dehydrogenase